MASVSLFRTALEQFSQLGSSFKKAMAELFYSGILDNDWSLNLVQFKGRRALAVCVRISMGIQHVLGFECALCWMDS